MKNYEKNIENVKICFKISDMLKDLRFCYLKQKLFYKNCETVGSMLLTTIHYHIIYFGERKMWMGKNEYQITPPRY